MNTKPLVVAGLGSGLLLLSLLVHRGGRPEDPVVLRSAPIPDRPTEPCTVSPPADAPEPLPEYWNSLSLLLQRKADVDRASVQDRVLERTVRHLDLDEPRAGQFRQTAAVAVREIREAWEIREAAVAGSPGGLDSSQESYEEAKRRAVGLLETFLLERAPDPAFLARIEEWIDIVR